MTRRPHEQASRARALLGCLALALASASSACAPRQPSVAPPIIDADTPHAFDGSTVRFPVEGDPTISYVAWFRVGAQDDPPGKEGLTWVTARLLSEGGTERQSFDAITRALYPMAAGYSARVDREMTTLTGRAHRDTADAFQSLFVEAYTRPAFAEQDFQRVRDAALDYLRTTLRYASDEELGKAALRSFVYAGTRYAHPERGTVAGLSSITLADVRAHYERHFARDRVVFALGGGFDESSVATLAGSRDQLPPAAGIAAAPEPEPRAIAGRQVLLVQKPGADASISFGYPLDVRRGEREYYALWVANSWLGEHRNSSSHLYEVIRERRGLNYGDYSYIEAFPQGGRRQMPPTNVARRAQLFEVWIRTLPNDEAVFALRAALRELDGLVARGMTPEQFELTRAFLRKYSLHFADTNQARLGYAVDDRFYGLDEPHLERFRRIMDELTVEEVNAALREHLQSKNLKIAIVTGDADGLADQLTRGAPTPIQYDSEKPPEILREDQEIARYPLNIQRGDVRVVSVDQLFER